METNPTYILKNVGLVSASWDLETVISSPSKVKITVNLEVGLVDKDDNKRDAVIRANANIDFSSKDSSESHGFINLSYKLLYDLNFDVELTEVPTGEMAKLIDSAQKVIEGLIRSDALGTMRNAGAKSPFIISPEQLSLSTKDSKRIESHNQEIEPKKKSRSRTKK